jgi:hypothetical protein
MPTQQVRSRHPPTLPRVMASEYVYQKVTVPLVVLYTDG